MNEQIGNKINDKTYIKLTPFKGFVLENFPFIEADFDAITNYQLLCKVIEYLNNVISNQNTVQELGTDLVNAYNSLVDAVNLAINEFETDVTADINQFKVDINNDFDEFTSNITTQFNNLQDYVDNYFDNNFPELVSDKLDEMAQDGTLENLLNDTAHLIKVYETHTAMINDSSTFTNGLKVKTLGYSQIGDGGNAEYYVTNTLSNNVIQEQLSNGLYLNLVIKDVIYINSLGADYTGTNDSSTIFNNVLTFINSQWLANNNKINTIILNGRYLWNNQVILPPCAKLKGDGFVTILTNVNGSALKIDYLNTSLPSSLDGNKQDWFQGEIINFSQGGIFKNVGTDLTNTCIEIGRDENIGVLLPFSRYKLCNFRIYNYAIGILHNKYHNYIGKFDNISFEVNTTGIQYGLSSGTVTDSGENMTYNNCLFSTGTDAVKWLLDGFDSSFVNCSFDFVTNVFNDSENKGYKRISLVNCHIEGITYICNKLGTYSQLDINNSSIITTKHGNIFDNINQNSLVTLSDNKIISQGGSEYDPTKLIDQCNRISLLNNTSQDALQLMFNNANIITNFDKLEDGDISNFGANSQIGIFKVEDLSGNTFTAKIVTDNYLYTGHKSLVFVGTTNVTSNKIVVLTTEYIPLNNLQKFLKTNIFTHNCRGNQTITYKFYDASKNLISETSGYQNVPANSNKTANQWYMTPFAKYEAIPINAAFVKIRIAITSINNGTADEIGTEYKLGGVIVN